MFKVIDLYKAIGAGESLLPTQTGFDWWSGSYEQSIAEYDREFARKFSDFLYYDFLEADVVADCRENFQSDVLSILTFNQKKYAEMYRIFVATDTEIPFDYNYDLTETYGKTKNTYTKGSESDTIGQHQDTIGEITNTHNVAPFNSTVPQTESTDVTSSHTDTIGQHQDTYGQRIDTSEDDAHTVTKKGNIGVQNSANIATDFTRYWSETYKFMSMIFDDIVRQLLFVGD